MADSRDTGGGRATLVKGALPPLLSQLAFSAVSFFSIAGLSRRSTTVELAAVTAAYALESTAVAYANSRWTTLLVLRESGAPRAGDVAHLLKRFLVVSLIGLPVFVLGGLVVAHSLSIALAGALWSGAMLLCDVLRFAASRYLSLVPVAAIALTHLAVGGTLTFVGPRSITGYLIGLSSVALAWAVAYWLALRYRREPGLSQVWRTESAFGNSLAAEASTITVAIGVASAVISAVNPKMAVGLQLGNQVLIMPAVVVSQAVGLPLSRRLRDHMDRGRYPQSLLLKWALLILAIPVTGIVALLVLKRLIYALLGERADLAYTYLPVAFLQMLIILIWQPFTMARRWTHGPASLRVHTVGTMVVYYGALTLLPIFIHRDHTLLLAAIVLSAITAASTVGRAVTWWLAGSAWTRVQQSSMSGES